jgi:hypothetical protein
MRANPGGEISPEDVVGRDHLIERTWDALQRQSLVMVAERRIGKTTVVKKMRSATPEGINLIYRDVEGLRTPLEFAEAVAQDVEERLSGRHQGVAKLRRLFSHLSGAEIAGVLKFPAAMGQHWRSLLEAAIEDLMQSDAGAVYVFVWDELPLMLEKMLAGADGRTTMDVLDTLRSLRQTHANLRMIYTGSVGLHHVLAQLRAVGYRNDPTNDMRTVDVGELRAQDGSRLALALLQGEELRCADPVAIARAISQAVDHVPYYIHLVVARMRDRGGDATEALADSIVREALVDAQDAWHLQHYRERLEGRYGEDRVAVVLAVLDQLAHAAAPMAFDDIAQSVRAAVPRERTLIQRWWMVQRARR